MGPKKEDDRGSLIIQSSLLQKNLLGNLFRVSEKERVEGLGLGYCCGEEYNC
jgi:hypothetical protein